MRRTTTPLAASALLVLVSAACFGGADPTTTLAPTVPTTQATTTSSSSTTSTTTATTVPADAALTPDSKVSTIGMGPVIVGMTVEEAEEAAGLGFVGEPDPEVSETCYFITSEVDLEGVSFMVLEDAIARVDIDPPSEATTRSGAGIGSTEQELVELFGDQLEENSEYVIDGAALVFVPVDEIDANYRVVFEMQDGVVASYRAGRLPGVGFAEGCV